MGASSASSCCRSPSITATAKAMGGSDARIRTAHGLGGRGGAIGGIVVDEHQLPIDTGKSRADPLDEVGDIVAFVQGRYHDRELGSGAKFRGRPDRGPPRRRLPRTQPHAAGHRGPRPCDRPTSALVLCPGTLATMITSPPSASTTSLPTTSSRR